MAARSPLDADSPSERQETGGLRRKAMILWLVAVSSAFLLIPLYFVYTTVRGDVARLEADIQIVQETLTSPGTPVPENQELRDELAQVEKSLKQIEEAYATISAGRVDWPAVMAAIGNYNPTQLTIHSITQADSLTLKGRAVDDSVVIAYSRDLEETGLFSRVIVQSLRTIATPFATPTSTPVGTPGSTLTPTATIAATATPTSTAALVDEYEVDDFQAKDIILDVPQPRIFDPFYDVDRVKFLAKAGRYYRVSTSNLAPGVDTFLTVDVGGIRYTNDDRGPGDLSSEKVFQGRASDMEAVVRVTNRGQYGPGKRYRLLIEEIIPTPTPTATPTPVTSTSTPTPDPRDEYEPDDTNPQPIAMGETQSHNFYPPNDIDKVEFLAKAGRWYRVSTSDLASGVDTFLAVILGDTVHSNDDREPTYLSSQVVFQVGAEDVSAVVKITNRGEYSADGHYEITVEEIIPTPVPTQIPTPSPTPEPESTPTPDLRDQYEPDDTDPQAIAMGETQAHNFYPQDDVDKVEFLAKAGRWYRVSTSDLALRVDTFLATTLSLGSTTYYTYTNDDRAPADLSSEIVFHVDRAQDLNALVELINRGQFGPDESYKITVEEIIPTPTPTQTPTPSPTPEPESTPTPDLRDQYEPDDTIPKPIAFGETQVHNFYPEGDADRVEFLAKAGRWYRVSTSDLALRVDTSLAITLSLGSTTYYTYTNDDRAPADLSSEIVFHVDRAQDLNALVELTNRGQFGPDESYKVTVEEVYPDLIGIGQTQERSFAEGVHDLVRFEVKEGYRYTVTTSHLALGVDTYLKATINGELVGEDDDGGPEPYASQVAFEAPSDDTVVVLITNLQEQYGPGTSYRVSVEGATSPSSAIRAPGVSSHSRLPGMACLAISEMCLADPWSSYQSLDWLTRFRPASVDENVFFSDVSNAEAVEFVIVLELK